MLNPTDKADSVEIDVNLGLIPQQSSRLKQQLDFMLEADKLKNIFRMTLLTDRTRRENSAEHSWHIAMSVLIFSEYAAEDVNACRVMQMLLVHDLVEIYAGDTYCYDDLGRESQFEREELAADRVFEILPADQTQRLRSLWDEFEKRDTPESRFANALDRVQPFLHNYFTNGQTWRENNVKSSQVRKRMAPVATGAPALWELVNTLIADAVAKGILLE